MDVDNVARGINWLDKMMNHLKQKDENVQRQLVADANELKWVLQEMEQMQPSLAKVRRKKENSFTAQPPPLRIHLKLSKTSLHYISRLRVFDIHQSFES